MVRSDTIYPGSFLFCWSVPPPPCIVVHGVLLPFLIGVAIETPQHWNVLMTWLWSGMCLALHRQRRSDLVPKKKLLNIFGPWRSLHALTLAECRACSLPSLVVHLADSVRCIAEPAWYRCRWTQREQHAWGELVQNLI